ncbi:MAG: hypothetical protein MN733_04740 [Nitrososphaera sp.]|nr:hypothetical protein [Nitrososphaera sp.]
MQLIEINRQVKQISRAPHKLYIIEFSIAELRAFKSGAKAILSKLAPFRDITDRTNLNVLGVDGDKGDLSHEGVTRTHGIVMDFRPLGIYIVYWEKPEAVGKKRARVGRKT